MKPRANQLLSVIIIGSAMSAGAWWGTHTANTPVSQASPPATGSTASAAASRPSIPRPRPIVDTFSAASEESTPPTQAVAAASQPAEIIPGGAIGGSVERLWETNANKAWQVRATPLTPPNWFITGVVQRGAQTQIIVQFDGDPNPRFLKVGDTLPGGGKLSWVRSNTIGVLTPDKKIVGVSVYPEDAAAQALQAAKTPSKHKQPVKPNR